MRTSRTGRGERTALRSLVVLLLALAGCAHYPVNQPLAQYDPFSGYRVGPAWSHGRSDRLHLVLAFSGGGTRSAALSYGVLEELRRAELDWDGRRRRLLDEVDVISGVSGGAVTAAYYGLFGERTFSDFESRFLKRKVERDILLRVLSPVNWVRLASPNFDRSDLVAEYFDEEVFDGRTFGDLAAGGGPLVIINATDMTTGRPFAFVQDQFDWICSDLTTFPLSRAVMASAAVPALFSAISLRNFAGTCGYQAPAWTQNALRTREYSSRRFVQASRMASYLDARRRPYVHLVDGGLADNLGLRGPVDFFVLSGDATRALQEEADSRVERVLVVIVNAETGPDMSWDQFASAPTIAATLDSAIAVAVARYNFETLEFLRNTLREGIESRRAELCDSAARARGGTGCKQVDFYVVEVGFSALPDEAQRNRFLALPLALELSDDDIDALRAAGGQLLRASPEFQRFLRDSGGQAAQR